MAKARINEKLRDTVLARDSYVCRACGFGGSVNFKPFLDCDHITAESTGGSTSLDNLQCLCKACNINKAGADWAFKPRESASPEEVWAHNQQIVNWAFRDLHGPKRLMKRLK